MEVRQLEHFIAVVEEQHFTRAARRCNLSQSALSASIRSLEREFGTPLFVRTTRTVAPTEEGRVLLDKARAVLKAVAAAKDAVDASHGRLSGSLRVGGIPTESVIDQPDLLARFQARHNAVEIHYTTGPSSELIESVLSGALDVAFISVPRKRPTGADIKVLTSLPLMFICRADHPFADADVLSLEKLGGENFIGGPARSVGNDAIARLYRVAGTNRRPMAAVNDKMTMVDFVASGLGVALLPRYLADARPGLVAVPLDDTAMIWTVGAISLKPNNRTRAASAFLAML